MGRFDNGLLRNGLECLQFQPTGYKKNMEYASIYKKHMRTKLERQLEVPNAEGGKQISCDKMLADLVAVVRPNKRFMVQGRSVQMQYVGW